MRLAEARYRAMVELIPAVTYTDHVGDDGLTVMGFVSPQMEDILGYPPQRFLDRPQFWFERMHPDDLRHLRAIDAFNNSDFEPFDHEYRMRHAHGHWVWVHDISTAVMDDEGNLDYFLGFLTDVSSRRKAEERLREAELRFRTMVEQNPAVFYVQELDPNDPSRAITTYVGPGDEELTGYPRQATAADPELWRHLVHEDDRERVFAAERSSNTDGSDLFSEEYRIVRKDGTAGLDPRRSEAHPTPGSTPVLAGVPARHHGAEGGRAAAPGCPRAPAADGGLALDAVVSMDMDGLIIGWNPQAETTFGWSAEEVIGRSLVDAIVPHAHRAAHSEGLRRWHETGEGAVLNSRIEIQALRRDGRLFPVELAIVPWRSARRPSSRGSSGTSAIANARRRTWSGPSRSSARRPHGCERSTR